MPRHVRKSMQFFDRQDRMLMMLSYAKYKNPSCPFALPITILSNFFHPWCTSRKNTQPSKVPSLVPCRKNVMIDW